MEKVKKALAIALILLVSQGVLMAFVIMILSVFTTISGFSAIFLSWIIATIGLAAIGEAFGDKTLSLSINDKDDNT